MPRKSGKPPVTEALTAEKLSRLVQSFRELGMGHSAKGLWSRVTTVRPTRPEKKSGGMEENRLSWR